MQERPESLRSDVILSDDHTRSWNARVSRRNLARGGAAGQVARRSERRQVNGEKRDARAI